MNYPLDVGGVDDYPVKVGSMLLTLVEPVKGYEKAYNRWYERDHYYAGCMVGPWLFAGSRWVATREMKDRRWPNDAPEGTGVAVPTDRGSFVAIYWVEKGHHGDHFDDWARTRSPYLIESRIEDFGRFARGLKRAPRWARVVAYGLMMLWAVPLALMVFSWVR